MSKGSDDWVVLVTSGVHEGAHTGLPDQAMQVLGAADDCDICLADSGLLPRHCALSRYGDTVSVRSLDGEVRVAGSTIDGSMTLSAEHCAPIELGASAALKLIPLEQLEAERRALTDPVELRSSASGHRLSLWSMAAMCGVLLASAAWVAARGAGPAAATPGDPLAETLAVVSRLDLSNSIEVTNDQDRLVVSGIAEAQDITRLRQALLQQTHNAVIQLATPEQLLEQVTGVFRTNGLDAELEYGERGSVIVQNLDPDDAAIARVASFVRSDVPLLKNLGFKTVTRPGDPNAGKTVYLPGPGKRLTTVVDGDVAYIATEDGARYFEGSMLPGGHRVHRISSAGIEVEADGGVSILTF